MSRNVGIGIMRAILACLIFVAVVCVGLSREISKSFTKPDGSTAVATQASPQAASRSIPQPAPAASSRTITLQSDRQGHFQVEARVDVRPLDLMVDTGASTIALRESSAARLGIFPKPSDYTGRTQTANGIAKVAPIMLSRVEINGITVRDVRAHVLPDSSLGTNLLGMSFLSRVKFSHDRGRLILEQ
jgi:aspartyl protease family protein